MSAGIVEAAVKAILPDVLKGIEPLAEKYAASIDEAIDLPPFVEALLGHALELLLKRGTLTITTEGQITLVGHKGPHPDDA